MATRGLSYIKTYVWGFRRPIRLYLDNQVNRSYISANLIESINPSLIKEDQEGEYVALDLMYDTVDGNGGELSVFFDVVQTDGNEFILGHDVLNNFTYDDDGIMFDQGEVRIYWRG